MVDVVVGSVVVMDVVVGSVVVSGAVVSVVTAVVSAGTGPGSQTVITSGSSFTFWFRMSWAVPQ